MTAWSWVELVLWVTTGLVLAPLALRRGRLPLALLIGAYCVMNVVDRLPHSLLAAVVASPFFYLVQTAALAVLVAAVWRVLPGR